VVFNVGPFSASGPLEGDKISNRGFNALLMDETGMPTHFLKVRPGHHSLFSTEIDTQAALAGHPSAGALIPAVATTFVHGPMRVLVTEFIRGERLDGLLKRRVERLERWAGPVSDFLGAASSLWPALSEITFGDEVPGQSATLRQVESELETLGTLGLSAAAGEVFRDRLARTELASVPQHGDLWPWNVFYSRSGWKILDFEITGEIDLPLYDIFHLIRSAAGISSEVQSGEWLRSWAALSSTNSDLQEVIGWSIQGLSAQEAEAALIAYLIDITSRFYRRGLRESRIDSLLLELEALPEILDEGILAKALFG